MKTPDGKTKKVKISVLTEKDEFNVISSKGKFLIKNSMGNKVYMSAKSYKIVGEWLYGDILGCQVSIPSGTAFVVGVKLWECRECWEVVLVLQADFGLKFPVRISDSIGFFTNDYNDDTLPFEDFLKFIRSDNVIEERKYK